MWTTNEIETTLRARRTLFLSSGPEGVVGEGEAVKAGATAMQNEKGAVGPLMTHRRGGTFHFIFLVATVRGKYRDVENQFF